jgi:hypothetical protein
MQTSGISAQFAAKSSDSSGLGFFGDGTDGSATLSGNATLTRDYNYENLTINTGITINTGGFRLYVRNTLTLNGTATIQRTPNNGGNGGNSPGQAGGTAGTSATALAGGTLAGSCAGATGSTGATGRDTNGNGNNSASASNGGVQASAFTTGNPGTVGGRGGYANGNVGGVGGSASSAGTVSTTIAIQNFTTVMSFQTGRYFNATAVLQPVSTSATGGSSGGGSGAVNDGVAP